MLNPQQQAAVEYIAGPLLVIAGAGSGKTRVITEKIKWLIERAEYPANSIYAVTFTNKAALEMHNRAAIAIPKAQRRGLKISTFHTLGLTIIKKHRELCGLHSGFSIFDAEDSQQLLKSLLPEGRRGDKEYIAKIQQHISLWKNMLLLPDEINNSHITHPHQEDACHYYADYQEALLTYNGVDFDDLIMRPVKLLQEHEHIRTFWQTRIRYLLVDEYQDSNVCQYELVRLLAGERARFTVVGDDDQSIYAWRGARPENLHRLQQDYPALRVVKLEQNYRSCENILNTANQLISHNPHIFEKKLWSQLGKGEPIRILHTRDEIDEAEQVVSDLVCQKLRRQFSYHDFAILYRGNHQARIFEKILRHQGVPYKISGGQSWFSKSEIKDSLAYLKLMSNPYDDASFLRIINTPRRGIGDASIHHIRAHAKTLNASLFQAIECEKLKELIPHQSHQALGEFKAKLMRAHEKIKQDNNIHEHLLNFIEEIGYEANLYEHSDSPAQARKRMENIQELGLWMNNIIEKNQDFALPDVLNQLMVIDMMEQSDDEVSDQVHLMTLHAAKGLEFPFVYLVGMEENLLPHQSSIELDHIEEERRLAYVGITRAKQILTFSLARRRRRAGEWQECSPSRFIDELPQQHLEHHGLITHKNPEQSKKIASSHLDDLKKMLSRA